MVKRTNIKGKPRRKKFDNRQKNTARFQVSKDSDLDYKNFTILQKYINDRGKIIPRRISGITAKQQRRLVVAVKRARHLALLTSGGIKK